MASGGCRRAAVAGALFALSAIGVPAMAGSGSAEQLIIGDVQRVFDRGIIVVDHQPVRLFGIVAPRVGEPLSGDTKLLLRKATLGRIASCEALAPESAADGEGRLIARCRVGAMDLSALLVSSGFGRPCAIDGERPYVALAPRALRDAESEECPR